MNDLIIVVIVVIVYIAIGSVVTCAFAAIEYIRKRECVNGFDEYIKESKFEDFYSIGVVFWPVVFFISIINLFMMLSKALLTRIFWK